ncbi:hypothetical protein GNI_177720 [Gregarina niphandrodes]|uniref:Uncharacterized protein n=1 Tax=Gregarina niphandrodes TaxID=110365 RepID=A0A023AX26_GRENI|nr:hypothetical protein GNI_177720 [Gregarina niphandrodes]EZG43291.1 hypothetical protein GNI_177720 [Gregarina niphandrodes]|eukprot:XP_011133449.1 hypothetical protein GNI_177720 [Gregarina niphandrodes]
MLDPRHRVAPYEMREVRPEGVILRFAGQFPAEKLVDENKKPVLIDGSDLLVFAEGMEFHNVAERTITLPTPGVNVNAIEFDVVNYRTVYASAAEAAAASHTTYRVVSRQRLEMNADVKKAIAEDVKKCRLRVRVALDVHGLVSVGGVFEHEVVTEEEFVERFPKKDEKGDIVEGEFEEVKSKRPKVIVRKHVVLAAAVPGVGFARADEKSKLLQREVEECKRDHETQAARAMRNDILSMSFQMRNALQCDSKYFPFVTDADRTVIQTESDLCEQFAEDNDGLSVAEYQPYVDRLNKVWTPVETRYQEWFRKEEEARKQEEEARRHAEEAARVAEVERKKAEQAALQAAAQDHPADGITAQDLPMDDGRDNVTITPDMKTENQG